MIGITWIAFWMVVGCICVCCFIMNLYISKEDWVGGIIVCLNSFALGMAAMLLGLRCF